MEVTRVRTNKLIHIYNAELQCVVMWTIIPLHMPPQGSTRTDIVAQSFPRVLLLLLIGVYAWAAPRSEGVWVMYWSSNNAVQIAEEVSLWPRVQTIHHVLRKNCSHSSTPLCKPYWSSNTDKKSPLELRRPTQHQHHVSREDAMDGYLLTWFEYIRCVRLHSYRTIYK